MSDSCEVNKEEVVYDHFSAFIVVCLDYYGHINWMLTLISVSLMFQCECIPFSWDSYF